MTREGLEDAAQQELHRAGLGGEARHAGDVQVRRLGAEQEIAVEIDRRLEPARRVHADRDARGALAREVGVHPQRERDVGVGGQPHRAKRHRLQRLLGDLAEHRGGEKTDLGAAGGLMPRPRGRRPQPRTACSGVGRSEYAKPSVTTP